MSQWFLWHRKRHEKVKEGFRTKADAQRYKVSVTAGIRRSPFISVFRTYVVPATDELLSKDAHRDYYWA